MHIKYKRLFTETDVFNLFIVSISLGGTSACPYELLL